MHRTPFLVSVAVGLVCAASVGFLSCTDTNGQSSSVAAAAPAETAPAHDPQDTAHLVERSRARLELVVGAQHDSSKWIEVYAYETPELKRNVPLSSYLQGKDQFHYDQPSAPKVLLIEEDEASSSYTAYVEVNYLWLAYKHWKIGQEDPNKTELLEALEIWHFVDGEWYFQSPPQRRGEYFE